MEPGDLSGNSINVRLYWDLYAIYLFVWKHVGVDLDGLHVVRVVAQQPRQGHLPDLLQLFQGETAWPASIFIEKSETMK